MTDRFDSFVVFAEMRTGSNFLEVNLNAFEGVACHGEAFNPHFIGYPNSAPILGVSLKQRDRDPNALLDAVSAAPGLNGFRYFHDHDPRIFERMIADTRCAKVILTRDPLESYVSWKIAQATGQWKLTDMKRRKDAKAVFDPVDYADHVGGLRAFQNDLSRRLQVSGQAPFRLTYDDLQSLDVINGLAAFLGVSARLEKLDSSLKVQNPASLASKVINADEMAAALIARERRDLDDTPDFEPRRFANVPSYVAGDQAPLLFMPLRGGPTEQVTAWLASVEGVGPDKLQRKMSQKDLRQWKRAHKGHRSFTVLRHPVARAHHAFCNHILGNGPQVYNGIRQTLIRRYKLPLSPNGPDETYTLDDHRAAFSAFLSFLKPNLNGQTAIRVDAAWCTQAQALQGFGTLVPPDFVLREADLARDLDILARTVGCVPCDLPPGKGDVPFTLDETYTDDIETLTASAYQRDYMAFGFDRWRQAA
ncbi:MAG: nodulation protein NodH [Roseobacter sp.]